MEQRNEVLPHWRKTILLLLAALLIVAGLSVVSGAGVRAEAPTAAVASGWTLVKFPQSQPACTGVGFQGAVYYDRLDCGFGYVAVSETTATSTVTVQFIDSTGTVRNTQTTTYRAADVAWQFTIAPGADWAPGPVTIRVSNVDGTSGNFGETSIILNQLGAVVAPTGFGYTPGDPIDVIGSVFKLDQIPPLAGAQQTEVGATLYLQVVAANGDVSGPYGPITADPLDGSFTATIPGSATQNVTADASTNYQTAVAIEVIDATYTDPLTGEWAGARAGSGSVTLSVAPDSLVVDTSFVSSVGWVKPGETYPFRVFVRNFTETSETNAVVTIPPVDGTIQKLSRMCQES